MGCAASQTLEEKKNDSQDRKRRRKKCAHEAGTADWSQLPSCRKQSSTLTAEERAEVQEKYHQYLEQE
jgi:hypothetical protein